MLVTAYTSPEENLRPLLDVVGRLPDHDGEFMACREMAWRCDDADAADLWFAISLMGAVAEMGDDLTACRDRFRHAIEKALAERTLH